MAPSPERLPAAYHLPSTIYFFVRVSDQDGHVSLVKPLCERIKKKMQIATVRRGIESAGPTCYLEFDGKTVIGFGAGRLDHTLQLVIEVPSCEAYRKQDPRIEPTSLTFEPYQPSWRHGEWLPRIIVPIRCGPERISLQTGAAHSGDAASAVASPATGTAPVTAVTSAASTTPAKPAPPTTSAASGNSDASAPTATPPPSQVMVGNPYAPRSRGARRIERSNERLPSERLTPRREHSPPRDRSPQRGLWPREKAAEDLLVNERQRRELGQVEQE